MLDDAVDAKMKPYVMALGKVAHAWNYLQEALGQLFCSVTGMDNHMGQTVWHSVTSDRAQRGLLRAAIMAATHKRLTSDFPTAKEDILWLLDKADRVGEQRNNAVHAPMATSINNRDIELIPMFYHGNPRAHKLVGKDILAEFEWYEKSADALTIFAREAQTAIISASPAWPDRPQSPTLQQKPDTPPHHKSGAE
jgi:hypothetical protein